MDQLFERLSLPLSLSISLSCLSLYFSRFLSLFISCCSSLSLSLFQSLTLSPLSPSLSLPLPVSPSYVSISLSLFLSQLYEHRLVPYKRSFSRKKRIVSWRVTFASENYSHFQHWTSSFWHQAKTVLIFPMGLYQLQMALLVLDDSLLHFSRVKMSFMNQNEKSLIRDRYCPVTLLLHMIEHNWDPCLVTICLAFI